MYHFAFCPKISKQIHCLVYYCGVYPDCIASYYILKIFLELGLLYNIIGTLYVFGVFYIRFDIL
jgi:hypothetical protein